MVLRTQLEQRQNELAAAVAIRCECACCVVMLVAAVVLLFVLGGLFVGRCPCVWLCFG